MMLSLSLLLEHRRYTVATDEWLLRALGGKTPRDQLEAFQPTDLFCATDRLRADLAAREENKENIN